MTSVLGYLFVRKIWAMTLMYHWKAVYETEGKQDVQLSEKTASGYYFQLYLDLKQLSLIIDNSADVTGLRKRLPLASHFSQRTTLPLQGRSLLSLTSRIC